MWAGSRGWSILNIPPPFDKIAGYRDVTAKVSCVAQSGSGLIGSLSHYAAVISAAEDPSTIKIGIGSPIDTRVADSVNANAEPFVDTCDTGRCAAASDPIHAIRYSLSQVRAVSAAWASAHLLRTSSHSCWIGDIRPGFNCEAAVHSRVDGVHRTDNTCGEVFRCCPASQSRLGC